MEPKSEIRKTFRLKESSQRTLDALCARHATENASINYVLTEYPKEKARSEESRMRLQEQLNESIADVRKWREQHDKMRDELNQLKNALALVGKFLSPTE